jgi:predicted secreted protein
MAQEPASFIKIYLKLKSMLSLDLKLNEKKELRFTGAGTAGYTWQCKLDDETKVKVERRWEGKPSLTAPVGASSDELFTVTALKKGKVQATFLQYRPWEPEISAIKKVQYAIEIE